MISVGLTGSIATGKSEVAKLFSAAGIPVFDSDAEVHGLYAETATRDLLGKVFPDVIIDGEIDRQRLGQRVLGSPEDLRKLEAGTVLSPIGESKVPLLSSLISRFSLKRTRRRSWIM